MAIIRLMLGKLILLFDWIFTPKGTNRDPKQEAQIDNLTSNLNLYQYKVRPFCVKVRLDIKRQSLIIETPDVEWADNARQELLAGGGNLKVPCLRVEDAGAGLSEPLYLSYTWS